MLFVFLKILTIPIPVFFVTLQREQKSKAMKRTINSSQVKKSILLDRILSSLITIVCIGIYIGLGVGLSLLMEQCGITPVEIEGCL